MCPSWELARALGSGLALGSTHQVGGRPIRGRDCSRRSPPTGGRGGRRPPDLRGIRPNRMRHWRCRAVGSVARRMESQGDPALANGWLEISVTLLLRALRILGDGGCHRDKFGSVSAPGKSGVRELAASCGTCWTRSGCGTRPRELGECCGTDGQSSWSRSDSSTSSDRSVPATPRAALRSMACFPVNAILTRLPSSTTGISTVPCPASIPNSSR